MFNTHSWDLGLYSQQTWLYSQLSATYNTVRGTNLLSDHFGITLFLLAPIYKIFPRAETLLILQAILVTLSALPLYLITKKMFKSALAGSIIVFAYLSSSGIREAINFDFHLATIAVFFYAFFLYFWLNKKYVWSIVFVILAMLCKEDVPLYVAFTALGLITQDLKNKRNFMYSTWLFIGSLMSFVAIMKIMLMVPATSANFNYFSFGYLGDNYADVLKNLFTHPVIILKKTWEGFITNPTKVATFKTYFYGFWYLPLLSFDIMIFSIPFLITKFASDRMPQWLLTGQYSVIGMFVLALATAYSISRISRYLKFSRAMLITILTIFLIFTIKYNVITMAKPYWNVFSKQKWQQTNQFDGLNNFMKKIPDDASVGTQDQIVPHLASRKDIYVVRCKYCIAPEDINFDYILLDDRFDIGFNPRNESEFRAVIDENVTEQHDFEITDIDQAEDHTTYLLKNIKKNL